MPGFFDIEFSTKKITPLLAKCSACQLYKTCNSPKMPVSGDGRRKVLILGEAPGSTEDSQGIQFIGSSGELLRRTLRRIGIDMRKDCWITNSLICHPKDQKGSNRTPTSKEIDFCRPNLLRTINELKPEVIIPLGSVAVHSLIGWYWKDEIGAIGRWVGWQIPLQAINAWVCPTWHPSYIMRTEHVKESEVLNLFFERHLKAAFKKTSRPWKEVPDYKSQVKTIIDPNEAAKEIRKITESGKLTAFDYETTTLKPDSAVANIICCSMSDGDTTIAYPWYGEAITATQEFIRSLVPKVMSNAKFEIRWTMKEFKHGVRNVAWDTMLAAHALDNRPGITSIKFQSFALLGWRGYNEHIDPFFKSKDSNSQNKIKEMSLPALLSYCGLDSLLELEVAKIQMKQMGVAL